MGVRADIGGLADGRAGRLDRAEHDPAHLHASLAGPEWTVDACVLSLAVLLMAGAALGDRLGRRRLFTAGIGLFTAGSAACALAQNIGWLIAARAVRGVGAAVMRALALLSSHLIRIEPVECRC